VETKKLTDKILDTIFWIFAIPILILMGTSLVIVFFKFTLLLATK